ncbi:MAG: hypothetical protein MJ054_01350 [Clostridia bacterium]|nr:hypothetical protein [Clostridia bacterium]
MLNIYQPDRSHIKKCVITYSIFYFVVIAGAYIFQENFTDVLRSSIGAFDIFRLTAGQFAYDIALLAFGIGSITGISFLTYFTLNKLHNHLVEKKSLTVKSN